MLDERIGALPVVAKGSTLPPGACPQLARVIVRPQDREGHILMHNSLKRMWALLGVVAAIAAVAATSAIASHKAGPTIVIWTDANRAPAVTKVANAWAAANGATIQVVDEGLRLDPRRTLGTVAAADAPDVVLAAHDWTGQLAANGLVEPLYPSKAVAQGAVPEVHARRVLVRHRRQEALRHPGRRSRTSASLVNTKLAKVPTTFAQLESEALACQEEEPPRLRHLPSSRAPAATRTTCTRSSRASVATSSARTGPATSTRRTSASRTRRSSRTRR